jgi:sterol desaturase/sphingolipid hydroxylase (fatty acid hydroxylase superfamily)
MLSSFIFSLFLMITFILVELLYERDWKVLKKPFYFRDLFYFIPFSLVIGVVIWEFAQWAVDIAFSLGFPVIDLGIESTWLKVLVTIFIADFVNYFMHRAFHGRFLWPFHCTHHVAKKLYWGKSRVTHPVESIISFVPSFFVVSLLGLKGDSLGISLVIIGFYGIWGHCKVDISYGIFDYVFISPKAHHIHHRLANGGDVKNIASFFSIFDICFGTFEKPKKQVFEYGASGRDWTTLYDQFYEPFRMIYRKYIK